MKRILVVGNKFAKFRDDKSDVLTFDEFARLAWRGGLQQACEIWLGQGIEHDRLFGVLALLQKRHSGNECRIHNLHQLLDQADPVHQSTAHKAYRENVLITRPQRVGEATFESWLSLQDSGEFLSDHMTGQHVQGMIVIESARQMMLSVSETFLLDDARDARYYFVLNSVNTEYLQFAFPLPTLLSHEIVSHSTGKNGSLKASCRTSLFQNGALTARVDITYAAYPEAHINEKEASLAREAYVQHVSKCDAIATAS